MILLKSILATHLFNNIYRDFQRICLNFTYHKINTLPFSYHSQRFQTILLYRLIANSFEQTNFYNEQVGRKIQTNDNTVPEQSKVGNQILNSSKLCEAIRSVPHNQLHWTKIAKYGYLHIVYILWMDWLCCILCLLFWCFTWIVFGVVLLFCHFIG